MSVATLEAQIKSLPEECLEEVSHFIEYVISKPGSSESLIMIAFFQKQALVKLLEK